MASQNRTPAARTYAHRAAQKLVAFRKSRGWTQSRLAAELKRSRSRIALVETGALKPSMKLVGELRELADIEPNDWFAPAEGQPELAGP